MGRRVFLGALLTTRFGFAATPFWNKKDPHAWSADEILQLTTHSPWAVTARVLPKPRHDKGSFTPDQPEVAGGRAGGRGNGPIPVVPVDEVTVVWASARPLLDALKSNFPKDFANHYIISISGLPGNLGGTQASLQTKAKEAVGAGIADRIKTATVFGFSKELLPLTLADKEVTFNLETEQFSIRARFSLKEMTYRGTLAV